MCGTRYTGLFLSDPFGRVFRLMQGDAKVPIMVAEMPQRVLQRVHYEVTLFMLLTTGFCRNAKATFKPISLSIYVHRLCIYIYLYRLCIYVGLYIYIVASIFFSIIGMRCFLSLLKTFQ